MIAVQEDFNTRCQEVDIYFRFLRAFEDERVVFCEPPAGQPDEPPNDQRPMSDSDHVDRSGRGEARPVPNDQQALSDSDQDSLFKTLKANGFLLLYNLVESTLKNAIEAIFDEFKSRGVSFDDCRQEVRKIVLANLKRHNVDKILPSLSALSLDVVVTTFRKDELFKGNVDGRRIQKVASEYGFRNLSKRSNQLLTVKTNRNDLAHGDKSFAEVGRDYDVDRLVEIKSEVMVFLDELLRNVAEYIASRDYLARPKTP